MSEFRNTTYNIQATLVLDTKGLNCPMQLFETKKEISKLTSGQIIRIDVTDPASHSYFSGWCERSGHKYLGEKIERDHISFFIKKG